MLRGAFWSGTKFIVSFFGLIITAIGLFNIVVHWFKISISPIIEPLIALYIKYIPKLFAWVNVRADWMVPDWPPDLITVAIMQAVLAARAILAYGETDRSGELIPVTVNEDGKPKTVYVDPKSGLQYQFGIIAAQLAIVFSSICIPFLRYPASILIASWSLLALLKAFSRPFGAKPRGPEFITVYGIGNRRLVLAGRYLWGCIVAAALLLLLNTYQ
jgi:hypothetical protein